MTSTFGEGRVRLAAFLDSGGEVDVAAEGVLDGPHDTIDIVGLAGLAPGTPVTVRIHHADGRTEEISTTHTMSEEHIAWFRAGSALNVLRGD